MSRLLRFCRSSIPWSEVARPTVHEVGDDNCVRAGGARLALSIRVDRAGARRGDDAPDQPPPPAGKASG